MSAELWLEALGEIDGSYIEEVLAERQAEHRRRVRRAWLAAAACLVIVLSVAIPSVLRQRMENLPEDGPAALTEPEVPQKPPSAEGEDVPPHDNGKGTEEMPAGETPPADDPAPSEGETGYTGQYYGAGTGLQEAYSTLIFRDVQTELKLADIRVPLGELPFCDLLVEVNLQIKTNGKAEIVLFTATIGKARKKLSLYCRISIMWRERQLACSD